MSASSRIPLFLVLVTNSGLFLPVGCRDDGRGKNAAVDPDPVAGKFTCKDLMVDDPTLLTVYPSVYEAPTDSENVFEERWSAFLGAYGIEDESYVADPQGVYWTPDIERVGEDWVLIPPDDENAESVARNFIERWAPLLGAEDSSLTATYVNCSGAICALSFDQDYCGLELASAGIRYQGRLQASFEPETWGLRYVMSSLVPLRPVPSSPSIAAEEAIGTLVGTTLEFNCSDGAHLAEITSASVFVLNEQPVVFLREAPVSDEVLEFRLAWEVEVTPNENGGGGSWVAHIDAIDGTVLQIIEDFDC